MIKAVGSNTDGIEPVTLMKIIVKLLVAFKINIVYPITAGVLIYSLLYDIMSAASFPVTAILVLDMLCIVYGFGTIFLVIYNIWKLKWFIGVAAVFTIFLLGLFIFHYPMRRVASAGIP